ncbi:MAG: DUF6049 family protein, partial [Micrococcales bacterium]|nr:DUF6049 family protein [Micrococcales bacterium]
PYQVEVTSANTELTDVSEFFVVSGTVANSTYLPLEGEVAVRLATGPFASRDQFEAWSSLKTSQIDPESSFECRAEKVEVAGLTSQDFVVECEVAELNLGNLEGEPGWGPRGFVVTLATPEAILVAVPGYLTYAPPKKVLAQTRFSAAAGLVRAPGESWSRTASRLENLVRQTNPGQITWLVDPLVLAEEARTRANPETRPLAGAVLAALNSGQPVYVLPFGDPDLNRLAHGDGQAAAFLAQAEAFGEDWMVRLLGETRAAMTRTGVAWPNHSVDAETLGLISQSGAWALLTSSNGGPSNATKAGYMTDLTAGPNTMPALVSNWSLAATLQSLDERPLPPGYLLALLAFDAVRQQTTGQPSRTALVFPRNLDVNESFGEALDAILQADWVLGASLDVALETRSSDSLTLVSSPGSADGPSDGVLSLVIEAASRAEAYSAITVNPEDFKLDTLTSLFNAVSTTCGSRADCDMAALQATNRANQRMDQVSIVTGGDINLISGEGKVPVLVSNQSDEAVTGLRVELHPQTAALRAGEGQVVDIPAGGQETVRIDIYAVANGSVQIRADLLAPGGQSIAPPSMFVIRVRAGWEDAFTAAAGGLVLLVLVLGLVRSIQRRRSSKKTTRASQAPAPHGAAP